MFRCYIWPRFYVTCPCSLPTFKHRVVVSYAGKSYSSSPDPRSLKLAAARKVPPHMSSQSCLENTRCQALNKEGIVSTGCTMSSQRRGPRTTSSKLEIKFQKPLFPSNLVFHIINSDTYRATSLHFQHRSTTEKRILFVRLSSAARAMQPAPAPDLLRRASPFDGWGGGPGRKDWVQGSRTRVAGCCISLVAPKPCLHCEH